MKSLICTAAAACLLAMPAWAHDHGHAPDAASKASEQPQLAQQTAKQLDAHTLEDIERHRNMARAHEQAAQCLASGKSYDDCLKQLQTSCKGLALGKNCGMRHSH
ncbi:MAG: hypothetical protein RR566_12955 [Comamonas sp.]